LFYFDQNIVRKFIAVPDNVLANEDELQEMQYTEAEFESMRGKLEEFQQRARRVCIAVLTITNEKISRFSMYVNAAAFKHYVTLAVSSRRLC